MSAAAEAVYPWQQDAFAQIVAAWRSDRLPGAIGLTGAPGWDVAGLADTLAKTLLEITDTRHARDIAHHDLMWREPDRAVFKVDTVREISEFAVQKPRQAPRKVIVIEDAHLLNVQASNALLKTLEEPPPNTHLLLVTEAWGRLLPTLRSRCQRFVIRGSAQQAQSWLAEQGITASAEELALHGHAPLSLAAWRDEQDFTAWLDRIGRAELAALVKEASAIDGGIWLGMWYRHVVGRLASLNEPAALSERAALVEFADTLLDVRRQIMTSNAANVRSLYEYLVLSWSRLGLAPGNV